MFDGALTAICSYYSAADSELYVAGCRAVPLCPPACAPLALSAAHPVFRRCVESSPCGFCIPKVLSIRTGYYHIEELEESEEEEQEDDEAVAAAASTTSVGHHHHAGRRLRHHKRSSCEKEEATDEEEGEGDGHAEEKVASPLLSILFYNYAEEQRDLQRDNMDPLEGDYCHYSLQDRMSKVDIQSKMRCACSSMQYTHVLDCKKHNCEVASNVTQSRRYRATASLCTPTGGAAAAAVPASSSSSAVFYCEHRQPGGFGAAASRCYIRTFATEKLPHSLQLAKWWLRSADHVDHFSFEVPRFYLHAVSSAVMRTAVEQVETEIREQKQKLQKEEERDDPTRWQIPWSGISFFSDISEESDLYDLLEGVHETIEQQKHDYKNNKGDEDLYRAYFNFPRRAEEEKEGVQRRPWDATTFIVQSFFKQFLGYHDAHANMEELKFLRFPLSTTLCSEFFSFFEAAASETTAANPLFLHQLRRLELHAVPHLKNVRFLPCFAPQLRVLHLSNCKQLEHGFDTIGSLLQLELIHLENLPNLESIEFLRNCKKVKEVLISCCTGLRDRQHRWRQPLDGEEDRLLQPNANNGASGNYSILSPLEDLPLLQHLSLSKISITNLSFLHRSENLHYVDCTDCFALSDISDLAASAYNLAIFKARRCLSLSNVHVLRLCVQLKEVYLTSCPIEDWRPLLALRHLRIVDKSNYNNNSNNHGSVAAGGGGGGGGGGAGAGAGAGAGGGINPIPRPMRGAHAHLRGNDEEHEHGDEGAHRTGHHRHLHHATDAAAAAAAGGLRNIIDSDEDYHSRVDPSIKRQVKNLDWVHTCPFLVSVCISFCDDSIMHEGELYKLRNLHFLQSLDISGLSKVYTTNWLLQSSLPKTLRVLNLMDCQNIHSFEGVGALQVLRKLLLSDNQNLLSLDWLTRCTRLREFHCFSCFQLEDYTPLGQLPLLRILHLTQSPIKSIRWIGDCVGLQAVSFSRCMQLTDISPLGHLRALRYVSLFRCGVRCIGPVAALAHTSSNTASTSEEGSVVVTRRSNGAGSGTCPHQNYFYPNHRQLQRGWVWGRRLFSTCRQLVSRLLRQTWLATQQTVVPEGPGLQHCQSLLVVSLKGCEYLEDLRPLTGLVHLKIIDVSYSNKVQDMACLRSCPSLEVVVGVNGYPWLLGARSAV